MILKKDFYQEVFPLEISNKIPLRLDLRPMGIEIDSLTPEQEQYLTSWEEGT